VTLTKSKPTKVVICWRSFAGNEYAVAKGTRYSTDDAVVQAHPEHFIDAALPESMWPRDDYMVPEREPIGRVKLRVLPVAGERKHSALVWHRGTEYYAGDTLEAEGADAEHLLDVGACEIVKKLPAKKEKND
jgi:hypothetical protein